MRVGFFAGLLWSVSSRQKTSWHNAGRAQIRNTNSEVRKKSEARKRHDLKVLPQSDAPPLDFGFRISFGLRTSDFGLAALTHPIQQDGIDSLPPVRQTVSAQVKLGQTGHVPRAHTRGRPVLH